MMFKYLLLITLLFIISPVNSVGIVSRRVLYNLTVSYAFNSSSIVLVNNQIPGPLIQAELNDVLVVHVTNNLPESERLAIHFHGMHVRQSPQMDGVPFVTQLPIESQRSFVYVFRAYPAGTFFYHSHSGLQSVTAFGPLIVHNRRRPWNMPEMPSGPLLLSDSWTQPDRLTQQNGLLASPFVWQGEPTYLLINGKLDFSVTVNPNTKYLLRLIGATTLSTVVFGIEEHPMTVVEVDGTLIKPRENVSSIELASGQRYAVIVQTKPQATGIFLMQLSIRWRTLVNGSNCTGVLRYGNLTQTPTNLSSLPEPILATNDELFSFSSNDPYETLYALDQMPKRAADKEIFLNNFQARPPNSLGLKWYTNNASVADFSLANLSRSLLNDLYNGISNNLPNDVIYSMEQNQLVDIVFQNRVATNGVCESHPFHMHGHKFWIHSHGTGLYNASDNVTPTTDSPVLRDTMILYASSYSHLAPNRSTSNYMLPCGWIKIRVVADNPGLWLLHCHIGSHLFMGMVVLLKEDIEHLSMNSLSQY